MNNQTKSVLATTDTTKLVGGKTTAAAAASSSWFSILLIVVDAFLVVAAASLGIACIVIYSETVSLQDEAHQRALSHFSIVRTAVERARGTGLPWYDTLVYPSQCQHIFILNAEEKHGFRPA